MKEKGMTLFYDWLEPLKELEADDFKNLIYAMAEYHQEGKTEVELSGMAQFASMFIFKQIDRQREKSVLGKTGGRPRKNTSVNNKEEAEEDELACQEEEAEKIQPKKEAKLPKEEKPKAKETVEKKRYGEFQNVLLTDEEHANLKKKFPMDYKRRIDDLSFYINSKGDNYSSHYGTILTWDRNKKEEVRANDTHITSTFDTDEFFQAALERSQREIDIMAAKQRALEQLDKMGKDEVRGKSE